MVMTGTSVDFNRRSIDTAPGQIEGDKGLGRELITEFLVDIPGIKENAVRQQLATLKASGDYDDSAPRPVLRWFAASA
jgi:hypothetical protein